MSRAERYTRLPKAVYPAHVAAAIAICESTTYRLSSRIAALAVVLDYNPDNPPLRPAIVAELTNAGQVSVG